MSEWIRTSERMPEAGQFVLAAFRNSHGKWRRIRAMYAAKRTLEAHAEEYDYSDYDEETDTYYVMPGWYECNEHEEVHWHVDADVLLWTPLPPLPTDTDDGGTS